MHSNLFYSVKDKNFICLLIFTDTMHNPLHRLNVDEILMIIQLFAKFKPDYKFDRELLF